MATLLQALLWRLRSPKHTLRSVSRGDDPRVSARMVKLHGSARAGIVTQACRTMVRHAFEAHQMHKVVISCAIDNPRSRAVAERLGFVQEGILRQTVRLRDRYVDGVFYGLLVDEWRTRAEPPKESDSTHEQP